jgi:Flp pilus assembly protein TadD
MQNNQRIFSVPIIYCVITGFLFFNAGCHWGKNSPSITDKMSETKFISKVTGQSKKDEIVKKKYMELLAQSEKPEKKEVAQNSSPNVLPEKSIQQLNYEVPSGNQVTVNKNELAIAHSTLMQKDYSEAARLYKQLLVKDPANQMVHHRLAIISDELKDFSAAEFHYRTALLTKPNDPNLISDLGYSYLLQGKYGKSEEFLRKAIIIDPNHVRALDNLGYLYGKQSRFDMALNYFRKTGSEIKAQRKIQQVKSELGIPASQQQPQMVNNQMAVPNLNQEELTEISPGPVPFNSQPQQTYRKALQAPNPLTVPGQSPQKFSQYNQIQAEFYQNQSTNPAQQQPSTYSGNQYQNLPSGIQQIQNRAKQIITQHYKGGKLIKPGDVNATRPRNSGQAPLKPGHSIHSLSPVETWPPADLQVPQNNHSTNIPTIKTTTYHPQNSQRMNQAIYTYPHGQKPNNISSIPTQYQNQNTIPAQQAAAIMGMNTGPGGIFPVMNQAVMNQRTMNQQNANQQAVVQPGYKTAQNVQGNQPQTGAPSQQQLQYSPNQNGSQNQNFQNQFPQNGYPQNQPSQPGNHLQGQNQATFNGMEVNKSHHLMQQSPIQIFEQKYFDDMNKARMEEKAP